MSQQENRSSLWITQQFLLESPLPFLLVLNSQSSVIPRIPQNIYHTLRKGHLGNWFRLQTHLADDVWSKKRFGGQANSCGIPRSAFLAVFFSVQFLEIDSGQLLLQTSLPIINS